jgi:hypothetical protein
MKMNMTIHHWWNMTARGKLKCSEKNLISVTYPPQNPRGIPRDLTWTTSDKLKVYYYRMMNSHNTHCKDKPLIAA